MCIYTHTHIYIHVHINTYHTHTHTFTHPSISLFLLPTTPPFPLSLRVSLTIWRALLLILEAKTFTPLIYCVIRWGLLLSFPALGAKPFCLSRLMFISSGVVLTLSLLDFFFLSLSILFLIFWSSLFLVCLFFRSFNIFVCVFFLLLFYSLNSFVCFYLFLFVFILRALIFF